MQVKTICKLFAMPSVCTEVYFSAILVFAGSDVFYGIRTKRKGKAMGNGEEMYSLAQRMGFRYYEEKDLVFGKRESYHCCVKRQTEKHSLMIAVTAKPARGDDREIKDFLSDVSLSEETVKAAVYENYTASVRLDTAADGVFECALKILLDIVTFLKGHGFVSCCSGCGSVRDVRRYLYGETARPLCVSCRVDAENELTKQWQHRFFPRHSKFKGIVVVFFILFFGASAWIGFYTADWPTELIGVLMTVFAFFGYQFMAGRMRPLSVSMLILSLIATVFVCHNICVAFELVVAIGQLQQVSITGALLYIPTFLKDPQNLRAYLMQLLVSELAVIFTSAPMIWQVYYSWHHRLQLESLEEGEQ